MKQRLHVVIAHAGIASRRKAEELISEGKVKVNGNIVKGQGIQVDPATDKIMVNGKLITAPEKPVYFMLHKPRGYVSTVKDPDGKPTVINIFTQWWRKNKGEEAIPRVYPVGRLDEDSEGLILLTNNGDLANTLTHPRYEVPKTYHVLVVGNPSNTSLSSLRQGVDLKEGIATADDVSILKHEEGNTWLSITIHQGMHHQIRRMCARVGLEVSRLIRVKLGAYELGKLPTKHVLEIMSSEV